MKENTDINNLLKKFHQGISSSEENLQLLLLLDKNSGELDKLAQIIWEQSPQLDEKNRDEVLNLIHQKLGFKVQPEAIEKPYKLIRLLSRYAAIFIIAFGLAWLFFAKQSTNPQVDEINELHKVTVAYGSKSTIELPDGSVVTLNSGSTISYPGTFAESNRTVTLEGEAFFDVQKNPARPFLVKTKDITIKVLGTKFNVKSYPDDILTEATLVTGKVEITRNHINTDTYKAESPIVLVPNQKAVFYRENNILSINEIGKSVDGNSVKESLPLKVLVQNEIKTETITSWKNNILVFNSEPFNDIIKKLERWYNVEVTLKYAKLSPVIFSGKFDKESIQEVLHALSMIEPFKYQINKDKILIYK